MSEHLAHRHDPDTSHDAVPPRVQRERVKSAILRILDADPRGLPEPKGLPVSRVRELYLRQMDAQNWPNIQPHSIARRMSELHMAGLIRDTGYRVIGEHGKPVALWARVRPQEALPSS